ncbi:MAG: serine/threonine-protein kinase [Gemmataceae bacterium]
MTARLSSAPDAVTVDLVEEMIDRLQSGADAEAFIAAHPDHADTLRRLLPAMRVMADLSHSKDVRIELSDDMSLGELGDFRLIREVGRGGMGVVYEAMQISLNRRVALKVLPMAATMDQRALQRFRHEAQAAAMLHHSHIVPVYGVGCERGVHYYAMQLIEGRSLADAIAEWRAGDVNVPISRAGQYADSPNREADTLRSPEMPTAPVAALDTRKPRGDKARFREVAEVVAQAADALEYAHAMGVVHRDIKPANLMLDADGHLWVTDFGLAKLSSPGDAAGVTMTGDLLGTLRYMSPEQALARHGLVDHRTDVYSLGATLYELLTLRPAVGGADKQEVLRRIAFEEPAALRKLGKAIPEELETITLKALAKNPAERYATAGELAADLRRWLTDQTIRARRPNLRQRLEKWVRRHSTAVVTAGVALLMGTGVSAWQAIQAREAQRQAEAERDRAAAAERQAAAISRFLQRDLLRQANTDVQFEDGYAAKSDLTVREALRRADAQIDERFRNQPLIEAALRWTIGQSYNNMRGERPSRTRNLTRAVDLFRTHLGPDHTDTLACQHNLAQSLQGERLSDAIAMMEHVVERQRATLGVDDRLTLITLNSLGEAYRKAGNLERAESLIREALRRKQATLGPNDEDTVNSVHDLGLVLRDLGHYPEAIARLEEAHAKLTAAFGPDHRNTRYCLDNLTGVCERAGRFDRACELLRGAIPRPGTESALDVLRTAGLWTHLGRNCLTVGKPMEAEAALRESLTTLEKAAPNYPERFIVESLLGEALLGQQKFAAAEPRLLTGYDGLKRLAAPAPAGPGTRVAQAGERVVRYYEATNQPEKARSWREKLHPAGPTNHDP